MLYISTKFCEIISNGIKDRADTISVLKITKGNNSKKCRWCDQCQSLHIVWSCFTKFCEIISNCIKVIVFRADTISILKIAKGNNSAKNVGEVTLVNLCTSSGNALYLCQVS